jgi:hypothetical protein
MRCLDLEVAQSRHLLLYNATLCGSDRTAHMVSPVLSSKTLYDCVNGSSLRSAVAMASQL